jgi:hypothetical protein
MIVHLASTIALADASRPAIAHDAAARRVRACCDALVDRDDATDRVNVADCPTCLAVVA